MTAFCSERRFTRSLRYDDIAAVLELGGEIPTVKSVKLFFVEFFNGRT